MATAEISGRKFYYEIHGPSEPTDHPPLLLINGMGGSCRGWLPLQVPEFSKSRKTLIFDHRGVAESEDPGGPFSTADLADDARGILDALEIERADVLGAFMGGMAAQELALRHPDRVGRLGLIGTYARPDAKRRLILQDWAELARMKASPEVMMRTRLLWTLEDVTLEDTELIETMVKFYVEDGPPVSADLFVRQCQACLDHDTLDRLGEIAHPTLLVCGRNDRLTPPALHHQLADKIKNARMVVIQFGAHLVMAESAERFNQVVLQFLDDTEDDV